MSSLKTSSCNCSDEATYFKLQATLSVLYGGWDLNFKVEYMVERNIKECPMAGDIHDGMRYSYLLFVAINTVRLSLSH